jgi:hypothetical protein
MKLYEAAVLETNLNKLPGRIEDAKYAIGQRVVKSAIDEGERGAIVKALMHSRSLHANELCPEIHSAISAKTCTIS